MKQTTALRKIASLKKKIRIIQGGQGAGKTIAILILIINHASSKEDREIFIASAELTKMRLTVIKDFITVMKSFGIYEDRRFIAGTLYRFPNGSFIKFIGLDKEDIGKGLRSHVFYYNELNKIPFETYRESASRADLIFADFNPNKEFYAHEDIIPREDCDFLKLTFQDNEYLKQGERDEILRYKELAYNEEGEIINKYYHNLWRVYGLGEIGSLQGVVFDNWEEIEEIPDKAELQGYGIDFGFAESPFAMVGVYKMDGEYYFDEVVYQTGLTNQDAVTQAEINGANINYQIYADSAEPKSIAEMQIEGMNINPCASKTDIRDYSIRKLQKGKFYLRGENLIDNFRNYVWATDKTGANIGKPEKKHDHFPDAIYYFIGTDDKYSGEY